MAGNYSQTSEANNVQKNEGSKAVRFRWSHGDKLSDLIQCLANYKSGMEYKNVDFSADKVKQYEAVRQAMARIYVDQPSYFGPERVTQMELINENDLEEKAIIGWSFTIN